jgi:hypothetical protein
MPKTTQTLRSAGLAVVLAAHCAHGADHDVHFLAEHAPESAMDAHYASLPWPAAQLTKGVWQPSFDVSSARSSVDLIDVDGSMVAFGAATAIDGHRGFELLGFYSATSFAGDGGRAGLSPWFLRAVPLDVPASADFTHPRGTFRHYGAGAALVTRRPGRGAAHAAQLIAGLLLERAESSGFELDYRLVDGASSGAAGVLDHSSAGTLLTPVIGWQQTRPLSRNWAWRPRALLAYPLNPPDFDARLTGPGFELATPHDGRGTEIGDPYLTLGLALSHRPSGFEVDLGGTLFYALAEHVSHDGVDGAVMLHFAWRPKGRANRTD